MPAASRTDSARDELILRHGGYRKLKGPYDTISANGALALIAVACSLLDRQLAALGKAFLEDGGFAERIYRARSAARRP
jgi:four helix bundle suffix protein